jgi:hypothetical protein
MYNSLFQFAGAYRQSQDPLFCNTVLAEQENAPLAKLKKGAAHMQPDTLLWLVRYVLYMQAKREHAQPWRARR